MKRVNVRKILKEEDTRSKKLGVKLGDDLELEEIEDTDEDMGEDEEEEEGLDSDEEIKVVPSKADKYAVPDPPADRLDYDEYLEWQKEIPKDAWNRLVLYVYRKHPVIDRKQVNPKNPRNIDKIVEPLTPDYFEKTHGGGTYEINVNYSGGRRGRTLCLVKVKVPMEIDPILDLDELDVDHHLNRGYVNKLKAQGKLDKNLQPIVPKDPGEERMETVERMQREFLGLFREMREDEKETLRERLREEGGAANKAMLELITEASKKSMDMVMENSRRDQQGPGQMMEVMKMMREIVMESRVKNEGDTTLLPMMFQWMMKQGELQTQMVTELIKAKAEPQGNLLDQVEKIVGISKMIGAVGGGESSWQDKLIDKAGEILPNLLVTVNNAFMLKQGMMQQAQGQGGQVAMVPQSMQPVSNPGDEQKMQVARQYVAQYGGFIAMKIAQGKDGDEFATELYETFSPAIFEDQIREPLRQIGVETVVKAVMENEQLRTQVLNGLGSEAAFGTWCMKFMEWNPEAEGNSDENSGN